MKSLYREECIKMNPSTKKLFTFVLALLLGLFFVGCGQPYMEETYYIDREFGKANMASFDKAIANPTPSISAITPEGIDGIHAEQLMRIHDSTYGAEPAPTTVMQMGLTGGGR
jgi:hypothetical protein